MKTNRKTGFLISLLLSVAFVLCGMGSIFFAMHTKAYADSVDPAATTQKIYVAGNGSDPSVEELETTEQGLAENRPVKTLQTAIALADTRKISNIEIIGSILVDPSSGLYADYFKGNDAEGLTIACETDIVISVNWKKIVEANNYVIGLTNDKTSGVTYNYSLVFGSDTMNGSITFDGTNNSGLPYKEYTYFIRSMEGANYYWNISFNKNVKFQNFNTYGIVYTRGMVTIDGAVFENNETEAHCVTTLNTSVSAHGVNIYSGSFLNNNCVDFIVRVTADSGYTGVPSQLIIEDCEMINNKGRLVYCIGDLKLKDGIFENNINDGLNNQLFYVNGTIEVGTLSGGCPKIINNNVTNIFDLSRAKEIVFNDCEVVGNICRQSPIKCGYNIAEASESNSIYIKGGKFKNNFSSLQKSGVIYVVDNKNTENADILNVEISGGEFIGNECNSDGSAGSVYIENADDVKITGGLFKDNIGAYGGINLIRAENVEVKNAEIAGNKGDFVGGLELDNCKTILLEDIKVYNNEKLDSGHQYSAGISIVRTNDADPTIAEINNCQVYNNISKMTAAGIGAVGTVDLKINNTDIFNNYAEYASAVYAQATTDNDTSTTKPTHSYGPRIAIDGGKIYGNRCGSVARSAVIFVEHYSGLDIKNAEFYDNTSLNLIRETYLYEFGSQAEVNTDATVLTNRKFALENLKIYNNRFSSSLISVNSADNSYDVLLRDVVLEGNNFSYFIEKGWVTDNDILKIENSKFINNQIAGEFLFTLLNENQKIDSCIFEGNNCDNGSVVNFQSGSSAFKNVSIFNSEFANNTTKKGAISLASSVKNVEIDNCIFIGNKALVAGGAIYNQSDDLKLNGCDFVGNFVFDDSSETYHGHGGAILHRGKNLIIENCIFDGNHASYGGAIAVEQDATVILDRDSEYKTLFVRNYVDHSGSQADKIYGGAIFIAKKSSVSAYGTTFKDNYVNNTKNPNTQLAFGGAISTYGNLSLYEVVFDGNGSDTAFGGAISIGYEVEPVNTVVYLQDIMAFDNIAKSGGVLYVNEASNDNKQTTSLVIDGGVFEDNTAQVGGAFTIVGGNSIINNVEFIGNLATNVTSGNGGAVYVENGTTEKAYVAFNDNKFENNIATVNGGAIYVAGSSVDMVIDGCLITNNNAAVGAGLYIKSTTTTSKTTVQFMDSAIQNNIATTDGAGVYYGGSEFIVYGEVIISGNRLESGNQNNLRVVDKTVKVRYQLEENSSIGVNRGSGNGVVFEDFDCAIYRTSSQDFNKIFADKPETMVKLVEGTGSTPNKILIDEFSSSVINYTVSDYIGEYDGEYHCIDIKVTNPETYTISLSATQNGTYETIENVLSIEDLKEEILLANVGTKQVFFRISSTGYASVTGSAKIIITSPKVYISEMPTVTNLAPGAKLKHATITGGVATSNENVISGTFEWCNAEQDVTKYGINYFKMKFVPTNGSEFSPVEFYAEVDVRGFDNLYFVIGNLSTTYGLYLDNKPTDKNIFKQAEQHETYTDIFQQGIDAMADGGTIWMVSALTLSPAGNTDGKLNGNNFDLSVKGKDVYIRPHSTFSGSDVLFKFVNLTNVNIGSPDGTGRLIIDLNNYTLTGFRIENNTSVNFYDGVEICNAKGRAIFFNYPGNTVSSSINLYGLKIYNCENDIVSIKPEENAILNFHNLINVAVNIYNFEVYNCKSKTSIIRFSAGGIYNIYGLNLHDNECQKGTISMEAGTLNIFNAQIYNNVVAEFGGAIYNISENLHIYGCDIYNNTAGLGGGIYSTVKLKLVPELNKNINIYNNHAIGYYNGSNEYQKGIGGGVHAKDIEAENIKIYNNTASDMGAGLYLEQVTSLKNVEISNNTIIYTGKSEDNIVAGAGIYFDETKTSSIIENVVLNNNGIVINKNMLSSQEVMVYGAGMYYTSPSDFASITCEVINNYIDSNYDQTIVYAAGIYVTGRCWLKDSTIGNNYFSGIFKESYGAQIYGKASNINLRLSGACNILTNGSMDAEIEGFNLIVLYNCKANITAKLYVVPTTNAMDSRILIGDGCWLEQGSRIDVYLDIDPSLHGNAIGMFIGRSAATTDKEANLTALIEAISIVYDTHPTINYKGITTSDGYIKLAQLDQVNAIYVNPNSGEDRLSYGTDPSSPFKTLEYAIKQNKPGTTIYIMNTLQYNVSTTIDAKSFVIQRYRFSDALFEIASGVDFKISYAFISGMRYDGGSEGTLFKVSDSATLTIQNSVVLKNSICAIDNSGTVNIEGGTFEENGSVIKTKGIVNIYGGTFTKNTAFDANTSVIDAESGIINIYNGIFNNNTTGANGGVLLVSNGANVNIYDGKYSVNTAVNGGVVCANGGTVDISGGTFTANTSTNGGVICANSGAVVNISGGMMTYNTVTAKGGVIYADGADVNVSGGAVLNYNAAQNGGVIYESNTNAGKIVLLGGELSYNTATNGGAVYVDGNGELEISGAELSYNTATNGGAIYSLAKGTSNNNGVQTSKFIINSGFVCNNTATGNGGAIYTSGFDATLLINGGFVCNNIAV